MKLEKLSFNPKYDNLTNVKNSIVLQALSYAKIYELLHKQLWRKTPYRVWTYNIPQIPTFNGRPVTFIRGWDIKSPASVPYSYSGGDHTFGLNQLFMEQDYRKEYVGDPKDGIYHDDCYIEPRHLRVNNDGYYDCFGYYTSSTYDYEEMRWVYSFSHTFDKQNAQGDIVINSVSLETYSLSVGTPAVTTHYKRIRIDYKIGEDGIVELGSYDPLKPQTDGILIGQSNNPYSSFGYRKWKKNFDEFSNHGTVVTEFQTSAQFSLASKVFDYGWIRVYQDGTVIEYVPESGSFGGESDYTVPAYYKILPMMYTDTGDLVMDRIEFVEKWNDYFELFVHEDSEWWQAFVKPVGAIISLVIAINTGLYFGVDSLMFNVAVAGGVASAVGTLTDNSTLSLIGGAMVGVAGLTKMVEQGFTQSLLNAGVFPDRAEMLLQSSGAMEIFKGFSSTAGFGNWLKIGITAYGMYNDVAMLGMGSVTQAVEEVVDDSGMRVSMSNEEDEEEDEVIRV